VQRLRRGHDDALCLMTALGMQPRRPSVLAQILRSGVAEDALGTILIETEYTGRVLHLGQCFRSGDFYDGQLARQPRRTISRGTPSLYRPHRAPGHSSGAGGFRGRRKGRPGRSGAKRESGAATGRRCKAQEPARMEDEEDILVRSLARETGITEAQAPDLINMIGTDRPSLLQEARILKRRN
jgi:hypothetical protein